MITRRSLLLAALLCVFVAADAVAEQMKPTVLVTGANRGLGYAWAEKYAERGWHVIATARRPQAADRLRQLAERTGHVRIEQLDVTSVDSIDALGRSLEGVPIDVLINNVGKLGKEEGQKFGNLDPSQFNDFMWVNAMGAVLVTERLWDNLLAGQQKKVASISAKVASFDIYPRIHRGLYFYKASKVALNMFMRNIALDGESDGVTVVVLSPGVVNTSGKPSRMDRSAMSPEMQRSMVDIDTSVDGMMRVMDELTLEQSGRWYRFDGDEIPW